MDYVSNSSYIILSNSTNSHKLNIANFYDINGNKIHTEKLLEEETGPGIPSRLLKLLDNNFVNKIRPSRIVIRPIINLRHSISCWLYVYDKNDNCIIHHAFKCQINNFKELINNERLQNNEYCRNIDWIWVKHNKDKIKFEIQKERKVSECCIM